MLRAYLLDIKKTRNTNICNLVMIGMLACVFIASKDVSAAIYKCKTGGKIEYQEKPCPTTNQQVTESKIKLHKAQESDKEKFSFDFPDVQIETFFQVVADATGQKLVFDKSITGNSSFFYHKTPWDIVLKSAAAKHNLKVKVENKTIYVSKPY